MATLDDLTRPGKLDVTRKSLKRLIDRKEKGPPEGTSEDTAAGAQDAAFEVRAKGLSERVSKLRIGH